VKAIDELSSLVFRPEGSVLSAQGATSLASGALGIVKKRSIGPVGQRREGFLFEETGDFREGEAPAEPRS
jgi:hypothetical protein